jgi:hypothetical protein
MPCERICNDEGQTIDDTPCQACCQKQPYRTHVYVSAFDPKTHVHFLYECTANAAKPLEEYFQTTGTIRGCLFNASRPKGGMNSKVVIVTNTANLSRNPLPNPPDIPKALAVIWRLPKDAVLAEELTNQLFRDAENYATKQETIQIAPELTHEMRTPPNDAGGVIDFLQRREKIVSDFLTPQKTNGKPKKEKVKQ